MTETVTPAQIQLVASPGVPVTTVLRNGDTRLLTFDPEVRRLLRRLIEIAEDEEEDNE